MMTIVLLVVAYLIIGIIFSIIFSVYHRKFYYYNDEEGPFAVFGFIFAWPIMIAIFLLGNLCDSIWNLGYKIPTKIIIRDKKEESNDSDRTTDQDG